MTVQVSVVIPARNDADGLAGAVTSSLAQTDVDVVEILICVGPSNDGTDAVAHKLNSAHPTVRVLANPAGGISEALNIGLTHARCEILVRVDARCELPPNYMSSAVTSMVTTGAANMGAVQVPVGKGTTQRAIALAMGNVLGSGGAAYRSGSELRQVETAFLGVFNTNVVRSVGGWDPGFARNEDAELNRRLIDAGHSVWLDPELRVDYEPRATLRGLARQYFDYGWWRRRTVARHRKVQLRQVAAPVVVIGVVGGLVLAVTVSISFALIPLSYLAILVLVAVLNGGPATRAERVVMAVALATMHLSWGAGFLASLIRGPWRIRQYMPPAA